MMHRITLFILAMTLLSRGLAQQTLTLDECLAAAMKNSPLSAQNDMYKQSGGLQQQNNSIGKLPQLSINGQATYQNDVTAIPIKIPGVSVPTVPKDQYKISLDANQLIYAGGAIDIQNKMEDLSRQIDQKNNEAELYKIRERVNQLYFNILLTELNAQVINNTLVDLDSRLGKINNSIRDGVMIASTAEVLQVEILKSKQRLVETNSQKQALVNTLNILTGMTASVSTTFKTPEIQVDLTAYSNLRPEFGVFSLMQQKLDASKKLSATRDLPKVYGMGTAGYGQPGYNMFKEGTSFFAMIGAKATWNIWNWHQTSRDKQIIALNSSVIENQKKAYDLSNQAQVQQYLADVAKAEELIKSDDEIISLRKSITRSVYAQLENGTSTATEFVTEQLSEEQALLSKNLHQMQLLQAKALYKAATGGL